MRPLRSRRSRRRRLPRVSDDPVDDDKHLLEQVIDEAEIKEVHMQFAGYFTIEQVKDTLMANKDDPDRKNKSVRDLKYKQGKLSLRNKNCRVTSEKEQREPESGSSGEEEQGRGVQEAH
jgi:hypothetical protein